MNDLRTTPTSPEHFERARTRVRIFTASGLVEGDYSHAPGVRLSDSLRNAATNERYMLLTDVTIAGSTLRPMTLPPARLSCCSTPRTPASSSRSKTRSPRRSATPRPML
ncbi:MAG TPA: hypothetical protein VEZ14_05970 [Dehalococcoidia bacterium]|nr:hypothetical protein [Dehalococcoidia bacterium]